MSMCCACCWHVLRSLGWNTDVICSVCVYVLFDVVFVLLTCIRVLCWIRAFVASLCFSCFVVFVLRINMFKSCSVNLLTLSAILLDTLCCLCVCCWTVNAVLVDMLMFSLVYLLKCDVVLLCVLKRRRVLLVYWIYFWSYGFTCYVDVVVFIDMSMCSQAQYIYGIIWYVSTCLCCCLNVRLNCQCCRCWHVECVGWVVFNLSWLCLRMRCSFDVLIAVIWIAYDCVIFRFMCLRVCLLSYVHVAILRFILCGFGLFCVCSCVGERYMVSWLLCLSTPSCFQLVLMIVVVCVLVDMLISFISRYWFPLFTG